MTPAFRFLAFLEARKEGRRGDVREALIKDRFITVREDVPNDFYKEKLPIIAAGTIIKMDFGGDFGMYGIADINGELHKIKIELNDLQKLDWSPYQDEIDNLVPEPRRLSAPDYSREDHLN